MGLKPSADPRVDFFDHHAPTWDDDADAAAQTLARLRQLRDRIGLGPGQDVFEAGCGTGRITGWLVEVVEPGRVIAADFSPAMLARAQARGVAAEFRLMDLCGECLLAERFDTVFCFSSFPHFRDQPGALRNFRDILKPGGQLVILHMEGSARLNAFHAALCQPVCWDQMPGPERWPALLEGSGLSLVTLVDEPDLFLVKADRVNRE